MIALGRPRCRWVDDVRIDLGEIGWGGVDWFDVARGWDRKRVVLNTVMIFWVRKMLESS
jgi:hypothetical protein